MPRLMIVCPRKGQPLYTGIDLPLGSNLSGNAKTKVRCNHCGHDHGIRRPYLEDAEPSHFDEYFVALDCEPNFAAEIGVLISCFALIEGYIPTLLQKLLTIKSDEAFVIISTYDTFSEKVDLLKALVRLYTVNKTQLDETKALSRLLPRIGTCATIRNKYAHGRYGFTFHDDFTVESFILSPKPKRLHKSLDGLVEDVNTLKHLICDLHAYLYRQEMPPPYP